MNIAGASGGNGIGGYDDKMPTAWEETWGTSLGTGIDLPKGVSSSMNIGWTSPTFMGGTTLKIAVAPGSNDATFNNDKGVSGTANSSLNGGYDILLDMNPSFGMDVLAGLNVFVGGSRTDRNAESLGTGTVRADTDDHQEGIAGATFAYGPVTVGYQRSIEMTGLEASGTVGYYQNDMFGISFNINDDLSISYGEMESHKKTRNSAKATTTIDSIQLAYSMGGMSLKIAETDVDNATYSSGTGSDFEATTVALSLAF